MISGFGVTGVVTFSSSIFLGSSISVLSTSFTIFFGLFCFFGTDFLFVKNE